MLQTLGNHPDAVSFRKDLVADHMEEIEWLLEHRDMQFRDPEIHWTEVGELEGRLWNKVAAVVAQGDVGFDLAKAAAGRAEEERVRAGVWLLPHFPRGMETMSELAERFHEEDAAQEPLIEALFRGLEASALELLEPLLRQWAQSPNPAMRSRTAQFIGYRRAEMADLLETMLRDQDLAVVAEAGLSAGKLGLVDLQPVLAQSLAQAFKTKNWRASRSLARGLSLLGSPLPAGHVRQMQQSGAATDAALTELVAIEGRFEDCDYLESACAADGGERDIWLSLGVWGYGQAVPHLLAQLEGEPDHAIHVARALYLITGADLKTKRWVAEDDGWDEDEPPVETMGGIDDLDDADSGGTSESSAEADEPRGRWIEELTIDADAWRAWWQSHEGQFEADRRYRHGHAYGATAILAEIEAPETRLRERCRALRELARLQGFGPGQAFEPDWWTSHQRHYLAHLKSKL